MRGLPLERKMESSMNRFERGQYHVGDTVVIGGEEEVHVGEVARFRACDGFMIPPCGDFLIRFKDGDECWIDATRIWSAKEAEEREEYIKEVARLQKEHDDNRILLALLQRELIMVTHDAPPPKVLKMLKEMANEVSGT